VGAATATLGPTGALLGKGGAKGAQYGYKAAGVLNNNKTLRVGWGFNEKKGGTVLRASGKVLGKKVHVDALGVVVKGSANPVRDGAVAGTVGVGAKQIFAPPKKKSCTDSGKIDCTL
jgi:hypothetical protein